MTDCVSMDQRLPDSVLPGFNTVILDMLAFVKPFHREGAVEGDGLFESHLERSVSLRADQKVAGSLSMAEFDVSLEMWTACRTRLCSRAVDALNGFTELTQTCGICFGHATSVIGRKAEHELRSVAYGLVVDVDKLINAVERAFIVRVQNQCSLRSGVSASMGRQRR